MTLNNKGLRDPGFTRKHLSGIKKTFLKRQMSKSKNDNVISFLLKQTVTPLELAVLHGKKQNSILGTKERRAATGPLFPAGRIKMVGSCSR